MSICIFASEVSALIGKNKYNPVSKAVNKLLLREKGKLNKIAVNDAMIEDLLLDKLEVKEVPKTEDNNMSVQINPTSSRKLKRVVKLNIKKTTPKSITKELKELSIGLKKGNKESREKCKELFGVSDAVINRTIIKHDNCKIGIDEEDNDIEIFRKHSTGKVTTRKKGYVKKLGKKCVVYGKMDAFERINGKTYVVETKHRRNRLFNCVPIYEKVQIHVYMWLTNYKQAKHIQSYKGKQVVTMIKYSPTFMKMILRDLRKLAKTF